MAKLVLNDEEIEVEENVKIVDAIEEAGVPIGCSNGVCGTCEVEVTSGMENLNEMTEEEEDLGMEGNKRLGCQCQLTGGTVVMEY
ncbi:MAG: 2Fe-2S iron-sulfur cluster-binding protein [Candidatus Margulisiibacteriota bacterium]|nr:2Fe-2S iron-sulfur cluster-binding protein [Candidatus Margulisiibacteriota bacterium]